MSNDSEQSDVDRISLKRVNSKNLKKINKKSPNKSPKTLEKRILSESIEKSIKKSIKKPIEKSIKKPIEKSIKKPIEKSIKKPIEELMKNSNHVGTTKTNSRKTVSDSTDDATDFENKVEEIKEALLVNYAQQKKLMFDLKVLMSIHKKELKIASKKKNNTGKLSGFNKPEPIPEPLRELLAIEETELARSKVTKILYKYFEDNNMYNTTTKKEIIPNKELKKIFGIKKNDAMTFYNLQTWLKKVYDSQQSKSASGILIIDD